MEEKDKRPFAGIMLALLYYSKKSKIPMLLALF
jgi:hypothetical protein